MAADGLEVTLAGTLGGILRDKRALGLSDSEVGLSATAYLLGAVIGALIFDYTTDRVGRKKLFTWTLLLYLAATAATAFSWNFLSHAVFRAFTGAGIGGAYAAINSAVDELIPARIRGAVDLVINDILARGRPGSSGLDPSSERIVGPALLRLALRLRHRRHAWDRRPHPETLRPGKSALAHDPWAGEGSGEDRLRYRKKKVQARTHKDPGHASRQIARSASGKKLRSGEIWRYVRREQPERSFLALALMLAQAFFCNAVFFTYSLVLINFYRVPAAKTGWYILALAEGNSCGPLVLGRLFDRVGLKPMIIVTYGASGVLLILTGYLFGIGALTAHTQAIAWTVIFFISSSSASAAYLTVSEIFPLEIRSLAITFFYACGTLAGGVAAPALFGRLIATHARMNVFGYLLAGILMLAAAFVELRIGVSAERRSLEDVSVPLSAAD